MYVDQANATSQQLAYVSPQGTAIIKVDNTTNVPYNIKRNSVSPLSLQCTLIIQTCGKVRITSKDIYPVGSLWVIDAKHMPFGCSVSLSTHTHIHLLNRL